MSKLIPLIKDQLANWDWDLSDKDVISSFDKSENENTESLIFILVSSWCR